MGNDGARHKFGSESAHDRFARQTVKSVALNTGLEEFATKRQTCGYLWHRAVKSGIEAGDMRHRGKDFQGALQYIERGRQMQWSKRSRFFELSNYFRRDLLVSAQPRPTMNDAMSYCIRARRRTVQQLLNRILCGSTSRDHHRRFVGLQLHSAPEPQTAVVAAQLFSFSPDESFNFPIMKRIQSELERRRTAVERQHGGNGIVGDHPGLYSPF